jgi:release factor glutamine methyltransferase
MTTEEQWLLKEKYHGEKTAGFFADCTRLDAGEPLAYLIGHIPFLESTIWLDSRPLIPRVETEYWVNSFITVAPTTEPVSILDLCAGSGCIGVAALHALYHARVDFVELAERHTHTIKKNCDENGINPSRYTIYTGDLFSPLPAGTHYHYILTNPPYIDPELNRTTKSVSTYEPHEALFGGPAGLSLITSIITRAPEWLLPHGELWIEHEPEQATAIATLARDHFTVVTHTDQYNVQRFSQLMLQ